MKDVPYLNPDPCCQFISPKNFGEALIDGELMTCLLDNGAQLNFIIPAYAHKRGMDIMSLDIWIPWLRKWEEKFLQYWE